MEKKKNPKADLEKSRSIFFLVGLIVAMGAVFAAFNISTKTSPIEEIGRMDEMFFEDEPIMQTRHPEEVQVIKPTQQVIEVLNIVDDEDDIESEFVPIDDGADENTVIDFVQTVTLVKEKEEEPILNFASKMPVFPGGEIGLRKFIADNTNYPTIAREGGIEGKVYVRFCVTSKGTVEKVTIARGVDPSLDKEALRVVKLLPKWKPGENGGRKVSVWYHVPINFQLK